MSNVDFKCPNCGEELTSLLKKVRSLENDVEKLSKFLSQAEDELETLGSKPYIGSIQRQTFHKPDCKWASYLLASSNRIEFSTHREAEEAGYKPCKTCCA